MVFKKMHTSVAPRPMAELIGAFDWRSTSLGAKTDWPGELQTAVNLMLAVDFPMALYWGPDLVVLYNDACSHLLRAKHPSALGMPARQVFAEVWSGVGPQLAAAMSLQGTHDNQQETVAPWLTGRLTPLPLISGGLGGLVHTLNSSAEVDQLRDALHSSNERNQFLQRALSHMGDYVYVWDRDKRFVYANERLEKLWGLTRQGYLGKSLEELGYTAHLTQLLTQQINQVLATGEPLAGVTPYTNPRGEEGHYEYLLTPLVDPDGDVQFVAGVSRDVSERQRSGEALRKSEERYRTLFDSIDEGFCVFEMIFDDDGAPVDYRWIETNPAFGRHTGLLNAEGRTARELVPDLEQHWLNIYGQIARTGEQHRFVEYSPAMSRWFEVDAFRIGNPQEFKVALLFANITQRKEAEQALKDADQRKDEFLATLAHELRNPLAAICAGVEIIKLAQQDPSSATTYPYQTMERQTQQLVSLVDDLLEVSRITRGTLELRKSRVDLIDIVTSALESCQPLITRAEHTLTLDLPDRGIVLEADGHRLAQVVSNLVNNAVKYTPPGGHIEVAAKQCADEAVITVKDSGIGIPADRLQHIFEMFAQIDGTHDASNQGLGVGLALAKSLVEMHDGHISVSSGGSSQGSVFTVGLPLPAAALTIKTETESMGPESRITKNRYRVMIVDDNLDAASTLSMLIEMLGNDVRTADGGQQAIDLAEQFQPQVIFMDLGMPEMDGFAAAEKIRQEPWGREMLIVALSGWGQDEDKRKSREAGFDHHLVKPTELAALKEILARLE